MILYIASMIKRRLYKDLEQSLKVFPVVGLIGSRQSGKTTLAKMISSSKKTKVLYLDLERPSDLAKLNEAVKASLANPVESLRYE